MWGSKEEEDDGVEVAAVADEPDSNVTGPVRLLTSGISRRTTLRMIVVALKLLQPPANSVFV